MGIVSRSLLQVWLLSVHAMKIFGWNVGIIKQRFTNHAVVAVGMVRWDATFIHLEEVNVLPLNASQKAAAIVKAACPTTAALTPTGRLAEMQARIEAMLHAVDTVRVPLEQFYDSLTDEQKAKLVGAKPTASKDVARTSPVQNCKAANAQWPQADIEKVVLPSPEQQVKLDALKDATAKAADLIAASCPGELPMTPPARLREIAKRLAAMLEAIKTVRPALQDFYASLNDEQKAQFNVIGQPGTARR